MCNTYKNNTVIYIILDQYVIMWKHIHFIYIICFITSDATQWTQFTRCQDIVQTTSREHQSNKL